MRKDLIFIFIICLIFAAFALPDLHLLGACVDEAGPGLWGIYLLKGRDIDYCTQLYVHLFGKKFPVDYTVPYCFALPSYLLIPFFMAFGINSISLKLMPILLSLLTLPLLYYLCKQLFNRRVAVITTLLLALSPVFINYSRIGLYVRELMINFFFIAGIFFLIQYHRKQKNLYLYLASYLLGAGLSIKLSYIARLIGLFFALAIFFFKESINYLKTKLKAGQILTAIIFFCLGAFLFIYYNIATKGETFGLVRYMYTDTLTCGGVNNLHIAENFQCRAIELKKMVTEGIDIFFFGKDRYPGGECNIMRQIIFFFLITAFIFNLFLVRLLKRQQREVKLVYGIYVIYISIFLVSLFSPGTIQEHHLTSLYPFPQLCVALFIDYLCMAISRAPLKPALKKNGIPLMVLFILLPLVLFDIRTNMTCHSTFKKIGVKNYWSPVLYDIIDYVKERRLDQYPVIGLAWLSDTLRFASKYEVDFNSDFICYPQKRQPLFDKLRDILSKNPRIYFIAGVYGDDERNAASLFKQDITSFNKAVTLEKVFYNKAGEPQYYLYKAE